jgi:hypothetical protein
MGCHQRGAPTISHADAVSKWLCFRQVMTRDVIQVTGHCFITTEVSRRTSTGQQCDTWSMNMHEWSHVGDTAHDMFELTLCCLLCTDHRTCWLTRGADDAHPIREDHCCGTQWLCRNRHSRS